MSRDSAIVFFAGAAVAIVLMILSMVTLRQLCNALAETDTWRGRFDTSPSWFTINGMTIVEWRVWWAVMTGRLSNAENLEIRRLARFLRRCTFTAFTLVIVFVTVMELRAPASLFSILFSGLCLPPPS